MRNKASRKSTSELICSFGSVEVSWMLKKQPTIALSTTEAEYRAVAHATSKAVWMEMLLKDHGVTVHKPIQIFWDNISSI